MDRVCEKDGDSGVRLSLSLSPFLSLSLSPSLNQGSAAEVHSEVTALPACVCVCVCAQFKVISTLYHIITTFKLKSLHKVKQCQRELSF